MEIRKIRGHRPGLSVSASRCGRSARFLVSAHVLHLLFQLFRMESFGHAEIRRPRQLYSAGAGHEVVAFPGRHPSICRHVCSPRHLRVPVFCISAQPEAAGTERLPDDPVHPVCHLAYRRGGHMGLPSGTQVRRRELFAGNRGASAGAMADFHIAGPARHRLCGRMEIHGLLHGPHRRRTAGNSEGSVRSGHHRRGGRAGDVFPCYAAGPETRLPFRFDHLSDQRL